MLINSETKWSFKTNRLEIQVSPEGKTAWVTAEIVISADNQKTTSWQAYVFQKIDNDWRIAVLSASSLPVM